MKVFFFRSVVVLTLVFLQLSFLNVIFPWFHAPLLLLVSVVSFALLLPFPGVLRMTIPLSVLYDIVSYGSLGWFSLYAVVLAYATGFLSRRLLIEHRGLGLGLYALFTFGAVFGYQLLMLFVVRDDRLSLLPEIRLMSSGFSWDVEIFSFGLSVMLFWILYFVLSRFERHAELLAQKQMLRVR